MARKRSLTGAQQIENMLEWASRVAKKAMADGYDAVHFNRQTDIGTIVLNEDAVTRGVVGP